jgi:hypothetical protein
MAKKIETRIGGFERRSGSRGCGWGDPHSHTLRGQRITVAATSATAQAVTKVFAGAMQLVT